MLAEEAYSISITLSSFRDGEESYKKWS